jgi:hypothetical protein
MRKTFIFFLWLFLLIFVLSSIYISFTAYLYERDTKMLSNISSFFFGVREGRTKVDIPYPEYTIIMYAKRQTGKFVSSNVASPMDRDKYVQITMPVGDGTLYLYVRKVDLVEYLSFVGSNNLYTGLLVASVLLYFSIFYFTLKEFELAERGGLTEELVNRLKALRLTMATFKIIPEESIEEMKKLVDSILKHRLSKR